jgi:nitroreductase
MTMDVFTAVSNRRSIRAYSDRPVEEEKLRRVLEAGRLAPSAKNRQEWKFIVVRDPETRRKLAHAAKGQRFVEQAPVVLVGCGTEPTYVMPCGQPAYSVDLSIAFSFIILEATELGLGTCWLGAFHEEEVKKVLDIPPHVRVVAMMLLGYPAEGLGDMVGNKLRRVLVTGTYRKPMEEVVAYDKY